MVQWCRKDSPFDSDEVVAALLCESLETVRLMVEMAKSYDPEKLKSWHHQAITLANEAKKQGFDIPAIEEKLAAL